MKAYKPNPIIVNKAAELWMDMLREPKYDNGDSSLTGFMAKSLVKQVPSNANEKLIQKFGEELVKILMAPLDWEYEWNGKVEKHTTLFNYMSVDYHPDIPLKAAMERSGLEMEMPWKTSMLLYEDHLSLGYGYGAEFKYFYPLSNGQWLATYLSGADIKKVIKLIEDGILDNQLNLIKK